MKYTVSNFAKKIDCSRGAVHSWANRGQLVLVGGYIDDEEEINKRFLEKRATKTPKPKPVKPEFKAVTGDPVTDKAIYKFQTKSVIYKDTTKAAQKRAKYEDLQCEKIEEDIKLLRLKNERAEGTLIHVDVVSRAVGEVVVRYKTELAQQMDEIVRDLCNENELPNMVRTSFLARVVQAVNDASKRADQEALKALQTIQEGSALVTK